MEKKAIKRYLEVVKGKKEPRINELEILKLQSKIGESYDFIERCDLCERKCKVNRFEEEGYCGVKEKPVLSTAFEHMGEERFLVPSYTIFFMGCNLHCQYCQNWRISRWKDKGRKMNIQELSKIIEKANKCKNINLVGGEPTPNLPFILEALKEAEIKVPVIWNSNFYMSKKSMGLLQGTIDLYLTDWKYGNNRCAERLSRVSRYWKIVERNHKLAHHDSEVVIRHLLLPNHFECCTKPILNHISENYGKEVVVNIMDQYRPSYKSKNYSDINKPLKKEEMKRSYELAEELNLNYIK